MKRVFLIHNGLIKKEGTQELLKLIPRNYRELD